jgi:basic amino acid/polyamine antiporter, APA family
MSDSTSITPGPESSGIAEAGRGLFVRQSTGLVRELSKWDTMVLLLACVLFPMGFTQAMAFAPMFWPHANMFYAFLISIPLELCFALVYVYFVVLMPRSGGDYVWVSRIFDPGLGFVANVSITFIYLTWISLGFTWMMPIFLNSLAYVAGIHNSWFVHPSNIIIFIFSSITTWGIAALMIVGTKWVARYVIVLFCILWSGIVLWMILMAVGSHSSMVSRFNAHSGTTVNAVMAAANHLGFSAAGAIAIGATLVAMVYCSQAFTGFQFAGYWSGEIKNVRRSGTWAILVAFTASAIAFLIATTLIYHYYGFQFFGSMVYMGLGPGATHWSQSWFPYLPALANFLPGPHWMAVFIAISFTMSVFWWPPAGYLAATRNMFAWSFDRLAPEALTEVNDRTHTPIVATVVIAAVLELLVYLGIYQGLGNFLLNIIVVACAVFAVVSVAAMLTPWIRPKLHEAGPRWASARFIGLPVITYVGAVSGTYFVFICYEAFHTGFGGTLEAKSLIEALAVPIGATIYYIAIRLYRNRQVEGFSHVFQEIPPE